MRLLLLGAFGLIGVFARYGTNQLVASAMAMGLGFPAATLVVNLVGSFLMGLAYEAGAANLLLDEDLRVAVMSGLLGGFTTFSAFTLDTLSLFNQGRPILGSLYVLGSVGGGIASALLGIYLGKHGFGTP